MEIRMDGVAQAGGQLDSNKSELEGAYNCDWNDAVHESFMGFVEAFGKQIEKKQRYHNQTATGARIAAKNRHRCTSEEEQRN